MLNNGYKIRVLNELYISNTENNISSYFEQRNYAKQVKENF